MNEKRLRKLLVQYTEGTITSADLSELLNYITTDTNGHMLDDLLKELQDEMDDDIQMDVDAEKIYAHIRNHPRFKKQKPIRRIGWWWAAAVALLVTSTVWIGIQFTGDKQRNEMDALVRTVTTAPADKLLLRLADGREIDLDSVAGLGLAIDTKLPFSLANGKLRYDTHGVPEIGEHTIVTPKGRQYQIVLPDGTNVWINAASQLTYPATFSDKIRKVKIDGEAYFEVQKIVNQPFVVEAGIQKVEVLGTHFNICAYAEDRYAQTTLLEGRVSVTSNQQESIILKPGDQATNMYNSSKMDVKPVDANDAISWRDNLFVFQDEEIQQVMRKVSRWYDVDVSYLNGMEGKRIGGAIPRLANIEEVMEALAATHLLQYQIRGRTVLITD